LTEQEAVYPEAYPVDPYPAADSLAETDVGYAVDSIDTSIGSTNNYNGKGS